jgi:outer membrane protein assembly factor BamB
LFAGGITALDLSAGKIAWTFPTGAPAASAPPQATPNPNDVDRPFYDNMVERVNDRVARGVLSSPAIVDGVIYVGSGDGYLYALR